MKTKENVIKLTEAEINELTKARISLLTNRNESFAEHSANEAKFVRVGTKYGVSNQVIWDIIGGNFKPKK